MFVFILQEGEMGDFSRTCDQSWEVDPLDHSLEEILNNMQALRDDGEDEDLDLNLYLNTFFNDFSSSCFQMCKMSGSDTETGGKEESHYNCIVIFTNCRVPWGVKRETVCTTQGISFKHLNKPDKGFIKV